MGTTVGSSKFTDQDYADDAVLFYDCPSKWPYILSSFDEAAHRSEYLLVENQDSELTP